MQIRRGVVVFGVLLATALLPCCGSGGASTPPPAPTITAVTVSPQNPTIAASQQQLFTATVSGTGNYTSTVAWSVNGAPGGNSSVGTISTSGLYTAPGALVAPYTVTVTAVSTEDSTKSGTSQAKIVEGLVSSVIIQPTAQNIYAGSNQLFEVNVQGTGYVNPNVTWTVNGIPNGNATVGTMSPISSGYYTAPDVIPNPAAVTITATSVQDTTKSGTATATILAPPLGIISVSVNPGSVIMPASQTQAFTANVIGVGNFNPAVTWSVGPAGTILPSYGTISPGGVYTPPNNLAAPSPINITVTSVADPSKTAVAGVQVFPTPMLTSISPNPAQAGDQLTLNGNNLYYITAIQFTGPNNLTLPAIQSLDFQLVVPFSAVSGPVWITTQLPGFAPVVSNSVPLTRIPALRIRAASRDLAAGESTTFSYRILGMPSAQTIQWTADVGSIDSGGNYQAPASVPGDTFAHIQGCISGTQACQTEILGLHPFRITPYPALVALGGQLQLQSMAGGATWSELAGSGSLTPGGLYTAGTTTAASGGMPVSATLNGATENATVGVTGGVPGVVSEISDYVDYTLTEPFGTVNEQVAVSGNHLYALATGTGSRSYFWIDVYDISDPINPVWIDAVETALRGPMYTRGQYLYQLGYLGSIAIFDISATTPVLMAETETPQLAQLSYYDGMVWGATGWTGSQVTIVQFNVQNGSIEPTNFQLPGPSGAGPTSSVTSSPMGTSTRLFVFNTVDPYTPSVFSELDTFDLTASPPTLLQAQPISPPYNYSSNLGSFLVVGGEIYDISSGLPVATSMLPPLALGPPLGFNGTQLLTGTYQNGMLVTDLSTLSQPKLTGVIFDRSLATTGVWSGQYIFTGSGFMGSGDIRVFDARPTGGGMDKATPVGPFGGSGAFDSLIYQSHLFEAIETDQNAFVSILDLTANPVSELSEFDTGSANPMAVQATGSTMYVGTDQSLLVTDISNPAAPTQISSTGGPVNALSVWGNYLYVGTTDGHLITYNIAQPAAPVQVSSQTLPVAAIVMRSSNNLLFIADDVSGLLTYNLANPSTPAIVSQFQPATAVGDLAIDGNLALLATSDQGMVIADITNPAQPVQVGQGILPPYGYTTASAMADGITLTNKVAYVGTWQDGGNIYGFDYSTAAHPRLVAVMPEDGEICASVLTLQNHGTDLFDGGVFGSYPFVDIDLTQPFNVINYYPIFASAISSTQGNPCEDSAKAAQPHHERVTYSSRRARLKKRQR